MGMTVEKAIANTCWTASFSPYPSAFDDCFQIAALYLGVDPANWEEVEKVLERFVYAPKLLVREELWVSLWSWKAVLITRA